MERNAMASLDAWAESEARKPLVVNGARQVGKTWLVREFARRRFDSLAHVVFLDNEEAQRAFAGSLDPDRLLMFIGAITGTNPRDGRTLVFLDEIQECPRAVTALKLFQEQAPEVPVVAAGSLLGVALNRGVAGDASGTRRGGEVAAGGRASWPVGKVSYLDLHPLTFDEFVEAVGSPQLAELLRSGDEELVEAAGERFSTLLREYLYVGGMPEAVAAYASSGDLGAARRVQLDLLRDYELDFSKHVDSPLMTERIRETWRSVPAQLAVEGDTRRFTFAAIRAGARGRDYRDAVTWLSDAGLVTRVPRVSKPGAPLGAYADGTYFKLYLLDVGLLGAATRMDASVVLEGSRQFTEYKGVYAEQFVCQHLLALGGEAPYYWSADGKNAKGEIDFIVERGGAPLPIEVKAGRNVEGASISRFCREHGIERAVRLSMLGYQDQGWIRNIPLYGINSLFD